ncbi:hypothetical protein AK88_00296 [Plasmodium fragile]|uniref:Helicase ATP-binding domain-containing protein n=1 Tax=Plasmodium fragile TaxID=5857 RepID=A0A0D9QTG6_PLAFR|nr:uncharacterized protein AK88_00296 [Plasmodium fragile]KJP90127.1 hypothetical protein AK88_00296 [Plasmodium fragile]
MENQFNAKLERVTDFSLFEKLKKSILKDNVNELYISSLKSILEKLKDPGVDTSHIICNHHYAEAVLFFYATLIIEKYEFVSVFCEDIISSNKFQDVVDNLKRIKGKHVESLSKIKKIIIENIDNCEKCLMIYYLLQKEFLEMISAFTKNEEALINFVKREIFKFNFNRLFNKIICPVEYDKVDSVVLELMLNGGKIFQVNDNYQLETSQINQENLKLFTEKFMSLKNDTIYDIIKKYAHHESLIFLCNLVHMEFKKCKDLLTKVNGEMCKKIDCPNDDSKKCNETESEENLDSYNITKNLQSYVYVHIFLLFQHGEVENSIIKVLKDKIILYSLMLNALRYADNFIQLIIFKIINFTFINDDNFLNDSNKKLIISILSYWVKLADACIIKMINTSLPEGNVASNVLKTDNFFLKKKFSDYDILKYIQCLISAIYLLSLIKRRRKTEASNLLSEESTLQKHKRSMAFYMNEYNLESLSLKAFFTKNDVYDYFLGILFSENKELINKLFNLVFKLLHFLKNSKLYISKNTNIKNKYFEEVTTFSCINIVYNILDVTKRMFLNSFEVDEYTKNLYRKCLREDKNSFDCIVLHSFPQFISHRDYHMRLYSIKVLSTLLSDSVIRDSLEKNTIFEIFDSLMSMKFHSDQQKRNDERKNVNNLLLLLLKANIRENKYSSKTTNIIFSVKQKDVKKYIVSICDDGYPLLDLKSIFEYIFVLFVKIINVIVKRVLSLLEIEKYKVLFMNVYEIVELFMKELKQEKNKKCRSFFFSEAMYFSHVISNSIYKSKVHSSVPFMNKVFTLIKNIENYVDVMYDDLCTFKDVQQKLPQAGTYEEKLSGERTYEEGATEEGLFDDGFSDDKLCYSSDSNSNSIKDMHMLYFYTNTFCEDEKGGGKKEPIGATPDRSSTSNQNGGATGCPLDHVSKAELAKSYSNELSRFKVFMNRSITKSKLNEEGIFNYMHIFFFLCVSNASMKTRRHVVKSYDLITKYIMKDEYRLNRVKKKSGIFFPPIVIIRDVENEDKRYNITVDKYDYMLKSYIVDFFKSKKYMYSFLLSVFQFSNIMILYLKKTNFINNDFDEKFDVLECFMLVNSKTWFYLNVTIECVQKYINMKKADPFLLRILNLIIDNVWKIIIFIIFNTKIKAFSIKSRTHSIRIFARDSLLLFLDFFSTWILFIRKFYSKGEPFAKDVILPELFFRKFSSLSTQILAIFNFVESNLSSISHRDTNASLLIKQKEIMSNILDALVDLAKDKAPHGYETHLNNLVQFKLKLKGLPTPKYVQELTHACDYEAVFTKTKQMLMGNERSDLFVTGPKAREGSSTTYLEPNAANLMNNKDLNCNVVTRSGQENNSDTVTCSNAKELEVGRSRAALGATSGVASRAVSRSASRSHSPSNSLSSKDGKYKENQANFDHLSGEMTKEAALEKAKKILEKTAAFKTQKRAIVLNETNAKNNKHQYFKEMKGKRLEAENSMNKYYVMLQEFLNWDFSCLDNMLMYKMCINEEIPLRFRNEEDFYRIFKPMVLEECRCCIINKMAGSTHKYVLNLIAKKKTSYWIEWQMSLGNENKAIADSLKPMDLIALIPFESESNVLLDNDKGTVKYHNLKKILKNNKHLIGLVDFSMNKIENMCEVKLINEDIFPPKSGNEKNRLKLNCLTCNKFNGYFLCNLMTNIREFQSVYLSRNSSLFNIILNPTLCNRNLKETKKMSCTNGCLNEENIRGNDMWRSNLTSLEKCILNVMRDYNLLNESQIEAVKMVFLNKNSISLIQGPPGTGKTKTVIGIISALYAIINQRNSEEKGELAKTKKDCAYNDQSENCNKKILVCSPSNSAIDEIAKRILNDGLINFANIVGSRSGGKKSSGSSSSNRSSNNSSNSSYNNSLNRSNMRVFGGRGDVNSVTNPNMKKMLNTQSAHKKGKSGNAEERRIRYRNVLKQTITPKCIRIGISKRTHEEIQPISLDYIFSKRKNMEKNAYETRFNDKKNKVSLSLKAIDHTCRRVEEVRGKFNHSDSKKYCFEFNETKSKSSSLEKIENVNDFFAEEIINNVDIKYLEKLLYLFNESFSHYEWSLEKLKAEKKCFEEKKKKLIDTDKEIGSFYANSNKDNMVFESEVIFSTLSGSASPVIENLEFEYLIIDEACQCVELSCLIPFRLKIKNVIMLGDPKQLPATTFSTDCTKYGYSRSLFERLLLCNAPNVLLNVQYRMREEICCFPNMYFYKGLIKNDENLMNKPSFYLHYLNLYGCYKFINIEGIESTTCHKSYINYVEAYFIFKLVLYIHHFFSNKNDENPIPSFYKLSANFSLSDIGIICPYLSQVNLIKRMFQGYFPLTSCPDVSTVDAFQGREKSIIIFSCVRSNRQALEMFRNRDELESESGNFHSRGKRGGGYRSHSDLSLDDPPFDDASSDDSYVDELHTKKWFNVDGKGMQTENDFKSVHNKRGNNIGFLKDERRLNVALTRAKDCLWIIGNKKNLEKNCMWDSLIKNAIARNYYSDLDLNFGQSTTEENIKDIIDTYFSQIGKNATEGINCKDGENDINHEIFSSSNSEGSIINGFRKNSGSLFKERKDFSRVNYITGNENKLKTNINASSVPQRQFMFSNAYTGNRFWGNAENENNGTIKNGNFGSNVRKRPKDSSMGDDQEELFPKRRRQN